MHWKAFVENERTTLALMLIPSVLLCVLLSVNSSGILWPDSLHYYNLALRITGEHVPGEYDFRYTSALSSLLGSAAKRSLRLHFATLPLFGDCYASTLQKPTGARLLDSLREPSVVSRQTLDMLEAKVQPPRLELHRCG